MKNEENADLISIVIDSYRKKGYERLSQLANKGFITTEHPKENIQIGITVFYDDKKTGDVRCTFSLFDNSQSRKWWKFWDTASINRDFIMKSDGSITQ